MTLDLAPAIHDVTPDPDMDRPPLILVVDDAADIREPLVKYLRQNGFRAEPAKDAEAARKALKAGTVDLVVLDVMMPGEDGLSLCRHVRATSNLPVILLTALAEETDRVVGLEIGADDYLTKPFSPRELLARIKTVLRRARDDKPGTIVQSTDDVYTFLGWRLAVGQRELKNPDGVVVPLSTAEFHLLQAFVTRPKMVLNRDQLLDIAYGRQADVFDRTIDNQVSRLRRKIERDPKSPTLIKTVWGGGYSFSADVIKT